MADHERLVAEMARTRYISRGGDESCRAQLKVRSISA
jgi:hypothetical protein